MENTTGHRNRRKPLQIIAATLALMSAVLAVIFLTRTEGTPQREKREPFIPVRVAVAVQKPVAVQLQAIGTVDAFATVSVKSRVDGQLVGVHFHEGQDVKKGDLLFTIDPQPFQVALREARARLERDIALADKAGLDAQRYAELAAKNHVSRDKYEQFRANAEALRALVAADRAIVERAQLQLDYCTIRAPMAGRTGRRLVDVGTQIKAGDDKSGMVEIAQIMPIHVAFAVPQQHLTEIKARMAGGPLTVEARIPGTPPVAERGTLRFLDNKVNSQTGTILLKAEFANTDRTLWPGQFVTAVLTLATRPDAVVIPAVAVQTGQDGLFVFVIKPDDTVEVRPVSTGMSVGDETVIEEGIAPGDRVVTEGQLRLVPGAKVKITTS